MATNVSFGKIVSTPTKAAWSQSYNAGGLFVVLALSQTDSEKEHESLGVIGKEFLNHLEAEFFTITEKNLSGIKTALEVVIQEVPETVELTSLVAFHKDRTLYLFLVGNGSIMLKRETQIGKLLSQEHAKSRSIHTASGHVTPGDTVILASSAFFSIVPHEDLANALSSSSVDDALEELTPHVHKQDEGLASAVVFRIQGEEKSEATEIAETETETEETLPPQEPIAPLHQSESHLKPQDETDEAMPMRMSSLPQRQHAMRNISLPSSLVSLFSSLSQRRKVFLTIAVLLIMVLGISVFFTIQAQQANERRALFNEIYPQAFEKYEEGEGIISLNKALAREELEEADTLLKKTDGKFPKGSEEYTKTEELKGKVASLLSEVGDSRTITAKKVSDDESLLLSVLKPSGRIASVEDDTSVYFVTNSEIGAVRKASKSEQSLFENNEDWDTAVGLGKFGSNFYILDTENGILKLVPSGNDYAVSEYLTEDVDLSNTVSMAIDASIYVLFENGTIKKFTRGKEESFSISGLDTPFKKPVQIVTGEEFQSLYVLDPGTARIVKINKSGKFEQEFQTTPLQHARAIAISQDEKTAYILSQDTLYEISL